MRSEILDDLIEILGEETVFRLALHFPGYPVAVPRRPRPDCLLAEVLNEQQQGRLIEKYSGEWIKIPASYTRWARTVERNRNIRARAEALRLRGEANVPLRLAREHGLTYHHVLDILSGRSEPAPPSDLIEEEAAC